MNPHTFIHLFCSFNKRHNKSTAHGTLMSMILDVTDFFFPSIHMGVSGNLWIVVKDVKTLVVYDVE